MFNLFCLCQNDEILLNIVAKNVHNVEATFDFVKRIVRLVAFDSVALTLLMVWTGLLQSCLLLPHCYWRGVGLSVAYASVSGAVDVRKACRRIHIARLHIAGHSLLGPTVFRGKFC